MKADTRKAWDKAELLINESRDEAIIAWEQESVAKAIISLRDIVDALVEIERAKLIEQLYR